MFVCSHTHTHTHTHTYIINTNSYTHHTQTTTRAHHTRIFAGEEWKRGKEARERENDKLKASLAPQSRKDLVKRVAEVLHHFEHTDNQKQENYNFIASLAPLSRKDLIERVVEVLDTQRYLENKQDKVSRYLRDELYAKRKEEVSGDEISDPRRTGGEVVEHGCASMKLKDEDLQAVKNTSDNFKAVVSNFMPVLDSKSELIFKRNLFLDSDMHLNNSGRALRTSLLIKHLSQLIVDPITADQ